MFPIYGIKPTWSLKYTVRRESRRIPRIMYSALSGCKRAEYEIRTTWVFTVRSTQTFVFYATILTMHKSILVFYECTKKIWVAKTYFRRKAFSWTLYISKIGKVLFRKLCILQTSFYRVDKIKTYPEKILSYQYSGCPKKHTVGLTSAFHLPNGTTKLERKSTRGYLIFVVQEHDMA